ncbi:hypothetical protein [Parafrankia sp. EUN1f]|uniref:hypothetical protein n=1 Tax=Parafrankia sp. EUN1f TaxID=102897 RepID=UPI0001C474B6|nr:hypothetical protein [Parafrankia sp. EUN1f]EFC79868.1 hypothetical protein FrEUN1fDRAFT_7014 [Parafrankia sp. EUN1f]
MATQARIGFEPNVGWVITTAAPGPAGTISLPLRTARVTVDAADVRRLVEFTVFTRERGAAVDAGALDTCRRLLGDAAADALAGRPANAVTLAVDEPSGPLRERMAAAAAARFRWTHDTTAPRLAALRLVAATWPLASLGATEQAVDRAWEALLAAAAVGRFAAARPALVDGLAGPHRAGLAGALATLTEVLTTQRWDRAHSGPIDDLAAMLTPVTDAGLADLLASGSRGRENGAAEPRLAQFAADQGEPGIDIRWRASSRDLRSRLGDFADEAFAGATARGTLPGRLDVQLPLRVGISELDAPQLAVRVHTWSGELLGATPLRISALPGELPRAGARVQVRLPALAADQELSRSHGVHVDIAVAGLPPLDAAGLRREAAGRARRAGISALLARHAGRQDEEAAAWSGCARLYDLAADSTQATTAREQGRAAAERAALGQPVPAPAPDGPDWADELVAGWRLAAREVLRDAAAAPPPDRVGLLRPLVADLSAGAAGLPELAVACEDLAAAILGHVDAGGATTATGPGAGVGETGAVDSSSDTDDASDTDDTDPAADARAAAAASLREALRVRYLLGAEPADAGRKAADLARKLAAVTEVTEVTEDEPAPGGADG